MVSFDGCGIELRHSLAYAQTLWDRCVIRRQPALKLARELGLNTEQVQGAVRLLREVNRVPSPERLALVVMRDWGLDDADIGEIFGRSTRWATVVRAMADEIRAEEPIPEDCEYLECGLQADDVPPEELYKRVAELREAGVIKGVMVGSPRVSVAMHQYSWWNNYAFVSLGTR